MGWHEAHRYNDALRRAIADLERTGGALVWRDDYAAIFGMPRDLLSAVRSRWQTMVEAQVEYAWDPDGHVSEDLRRLMAAHRGLLRAIGSEPRPDAMIRADVELVGAA